jgi:hypothetical protein
MPFPTTWWSFYQYDLQLPGVWLHRQSIISFEKTGQKYHYLPRHSVAYDRCKACKLGYLTGFNRFCYNQLTNRNQQLCEPNTS